MKILQVIHSMDPRGGGPAQNTAELGAALRSMGHDVSVACLDKPDSPWLSRLGMPHHALGATSSHYGFSRPFLDWMKMNHANYDAVLVRGLWQFHGLGTWLALRGSKTPYYVLPHGMLDPWFNREYPLKHAKKILYWLLAEYRVLRDAAGVLFTSDEELTLAAKSFWPYRVKARSIAYGIRDPGEALQVYRSRFEEAYPGLRGKKILLFLGRIHPKKGCDLLLRAAADVLRSNPEYHLVMAGPDQMGWRKELEALAAALGIPDRVSWLDMVTGPVKWGALASAEVFILPSHQENFGIAVAEALAVSCPVIITDKVNIWQTVKEDRAGFICPDHETGLKTALTQWLDLPAAEKAEYRANARKCFLSHFTVEKEAGSIAAILARPEKP